ncbi:Adaptor protein complex AP-3 delta subunit [Fomitiporia mediterranea MF3/22]|uniref:Adaptor protein complex AP-3 delta subunit n=1 Tax=Fomitiporia mediterranea (strain MF3/22) TaxID=694068 RepID=UPI0004407782|nr:Adaptor protein complex AP-3 delta subunit [Fomitiporia mediterranea MF3/22]EJC98671.1 Adaptor protein complex AP-3 delta subunit [Fomitiporia mediterranea MF3/22]
MWERNLQDLIRGLRAHKHDEANFIAGAIEEIRKEVRSDDMELKAAAVLKLTYLEMLGYDMSWASFHVVEVMSSPRFHLKSMGYLAATQTFEQETDVLMLTTNLLKKDMTSSKPLEVAVSLNGLSHIVTPDLGRDLSRDLISLLTHSRPAIRKRAVLALYKVFMKYPDALDYGMDRLKERLEDPDIGVVSASVNVLCELARQDPRSYLPFAPPLFHLLTTSNNNWMLIKIIKLFGLLTPHEPRLIKKLQPPITELITTTPAISLLYECVHTCIIGGMLTGVSGHSLAQTCVTKLAAFLEDPDQNLKYIALLAMTKIVPSYPHLVADYESRILASVNDQDLSIRMRALDLVSAMVNTNNLQSIVQQLLSHLTLPESSSINTISAAQSLAAVQSAATTDRPVSSPAQFSSAYRESLSRRILSLCSTNLYENVTDFEWYVSVLVDLAYVARAPVGEAIRDQLVDIAVRVRQIRRYAVQVCMRLLIDETFLRADEPGLNNEGSGCQEILWAAAWICGEYGSELSDTRKALPSLLSSDVAKLPSDIIAMYIQCAAKVFATWAVELAERWDDDDLPEIKETVSSVISGVRQFATHADFEVQERAANVLQLFTFIQADLSSFRPKPKSDYGNGFADISTSAFDPVGLTEPVYPKSLYLLQPLFSAYELNPVAPEAQASVPVPESLDLDAWIVSHAMPKAEEPVAVEVKKKKKDRKGKAKEKDGGEGVGRSKKAGKKKASAGIPEPTQEEIAEAEERERAKARRLEMLRDDPYYIIDNNPKSRQNDDVDSIPVVRLDDLPPLNSGNVTPSNVPIFPRSSSSARSSFTVDRGGEMPPDALKRDTPVPTHTPTIPEQKPYVSGSSTPARTSSPAIPPSSFQVYEVHDDETPNTSNPELIKVTKVKKKKAGGTTGKKKRAKEEDVVAGSVGSPAAS